MSNATSNSTTWALDASHSEVGFGIRHMMISTVKGSFSDVQGTIHLNEENFGASTVHVDIQVGSISTGNADRDAHLKSGDFFDADSFPLITFRSTGVEGEPDNFKVKGALSIRGESREVVLDGRELGRGTDPWGNPRVAFQADTVISRKEFGLTWNQALETGGVLVGDEVRISLEVQAIPASGN